MRYLIGLAGVVQATSIMHTAYVEVSTAAECEHTSPRLLLYDELMFWWFMSDLCVGIQVRTLVLI